MSNTKKKSLLERMGLVESNEVENYNSSEFENEEFEYQEPVALAFELGEGFIAIANAYEKAALSDMSKSIFKVDEFSKVLPDNLATDIKRQSVVGILEASNLLLPELLEDAGQRLDVLTGVLNTTAQATQQIVSEKEAQIAELLNQVDVLKHEINDRKVGQEKQRDLVQEEIDKINKIVSFIATPTN